MIKAWMILGMTGLILMGCNQAEVQHDQSEDYQPLEYNEHQGIERRGQIPIGKDSYFKRTAEDEFRHSRYDETNQSHNNDFNNEDAMDIAEKVNGIQEITISQVFTTDDHAYVAVMINPYYLQDRGKIAQEVMTVVEGMTDKEVTVYTNNSDWEDIKNFNARHRASEAPDHLMEQIRDFFQQNKDNR